MMRLQAHAKDIWKANSYGQRGRTMPKASGGKQRCLQSMPGTIARLVMVLVVAVALGLSGCGGGGGGSSAPPPPPPPDVSLDDLAGTWFGTLEDSVRVLHTLAVTFGSPSITAVIIDGVDQGLTGTVTKEGGQVFAFVLSDGTKGGFLVDANAAHAVFVDDIFEFGVVEKGATSFPTYLINDVDASWSGLDIETDDFVTFGQFTTALTCASLACTFTGSNGVTGNVSLTTAFDSAFGRWIGTFTNSVGNAGEARAFLSADKTFAGAWVCDNVGVFPADCDFLALNRPLRPGDTFALGIPETITISGTYGLPAGATSITTRCMGDVTVEIPTPSPQTNTCFGDGSQSITNLVTGASEVTYTFGAGASARVTVGVLF